MNRSISVLVGFVLLIGCSKKNPLVPSLPPQLSISSVTRPLASFDWDYQNRLHGAGGVAFDLKATMGDVELDHATLDIDSAGTRWCSGNQVHYYWPQLPPYFYIKKDSTLSWTLTWEKVFPDTFYYMGNYYGPPGRYILTVYWKTDNEYFVKPIADTIYYQDIN